MNLCETTNKQTNKRSDTMVVMLPPKRQMGWILFFIFLYISIYSIHSLTRTIVYLGYITFDWIALYIQLQTLTHSAKPTVHFSEP